MHALEMNIVETSMRKLFDFEIQVPYKTEMSKYVFKEMHFYIRFPKVYFFADTRKEIMCEIT